MVTCNVCGSSGTGLVHTSDHQPLGRYGFMASRQAALGIRHDLELRIVECERCGFAWNAAFDPAKVSYEDLPILEAATHSKSYQDYQVDSAKWLEDSYGPIKSAVEIGGGSGFFLNHLKADHKTIYEPSQESGDISSDIQVFNHYFDPATHDLPADMVIMRQVLEHIQDPADFVRALARSHERAGGSHTWNLYLEVPSHDQTRRHGRFYDFYYEHCNYFTLTSLAKLAESCNGRLLHLSAQFNGEINRAVIQFSGSREKQKYAAAESALKDLVTRLVAAGKSIALWGASGNGISSLVQMGLDEQTIAFVIDSDARKQTRFTPVTGLEIVSPNDPRLASIDCIMISSQFHTAEISKQARELFGQRIELYTLAAEPIGA